MSKLNFPEQQKVDSYFKESITPLIKDIREVTKSLNIELIHAIFLGIGYNNPSTFQALVEHHLNGSDIALIIMKTLNETLRSEDSSQYDKIYKEIFGEVRIESANNISREIQTELVSKYTTFVNELLGVDISYLTEEA